MGSSMGHVRNLDLSDLFLKIYHFYTKALLNHPRCFGEEFLNLRGSDNPGGSNFNPTKPGGSDFNPSRPGGSEVNHPGGSDFQNP